MVAVDTRNMMMVQESGMKENLWLNLSTGQIGSGRKNWDGSGGTGAAMNQFVVSKYERHIPSLVYARQRSSHYLHSLSKGIDP
jgi:uncharacterized UBP type Zn finger protein